MGTEPALKMCIRDSCKCKRWLSFKRCFIMVIVKVVIQMKKLIKAFALTIMACFMVLLAVSYTHLAVYKRQEWAIVLVLRACRALWEAAN